MVTPGVVVDCEPPVIDPCEPPVVVPSEPFGVVPGAEVDVFGVVPWPGVVVAACLHSKISISTLASLLFLSF